MQLSHDRRGSGEPLVLIHGIGSHWQVWNPVLDRLAAEREVIALDLPGFGRSPTLPIGVEPTPQALADAVAAFMDELGLERPLVGANSLGGWIALELARRGRARAVVATSPAGFWNRVEARYVYWTFVLGLKLGRNGGIQRRTERAMQTTLGRRINLRPYIARPERLSPEDAVDIMRTGAAAPGFDATLCVMTARQFENGSEVDVPVTIAWGTKDRLLFPRQAKRAIAQLPNARHVPLPGAGHLPMYDDPDGVVREMLAA